MTTTFKTLTGSVYQHKTEDGRTFVRLFSGNAAASRPVATWQECATVRTAIGAPAVIVWGEHRELIDGDYQCTITSKVVEIIDDETVSAGGEA